MINIFFVFLLCFCLFFFFFFNDTATTEIYTLSLHDALPISAIVYSFSAVQPLTAPEVSPATMRRWKNSTNTMIGMVITTAAAEMDPVGTANCELPLKKPIAAGAVRAAVV